MNPREEKSESGGPWWTGPRAVAQLLGSQPERVEALYATGPALRRLKESLPGGLPGHVKVRVVDRRRLDELTRSASHQGIAARLSADTQILDRPELLDLAGKAKEPSLLLALDGITDPHNLGALVRSAEAAGVHAVIVPKDRSAPLSTAAAKASAGALALVPIARVPNLARTLADLKQKAGYWVVGLDAGAEQSLFELEPFPKTVLAVGSEGRGLGRTAAAECDLLVSIPLAGGIESLNASVAGALGLFEFVRKSSGVLQDQKK